MLHKNTSKLQAIIEEESAMTKDLTRKLAKYLLSLLMVAILMLSPVVVTHAASITDAETSEAKPDLPRTRYFPNKPIHK